MNPIFGSKNKLSNVDAAWLHMEDPTNLMMVTGIMNFAEPIDVPRLKGILEKRLLVHRRFQQVVVEPAGMIGLPHWEDDPAFSLENHIFSLQLPAPADKEVLQQTVSTLMSTGLDFTKPLWRVDILNGFDQGSVLVMRIHHCIADGIALISVLLGMTGKTAEESLNVEDQSKDESYSERAHVTTVGNLFKAATHVFDAAKKGTEKFVKGYFETITSPSRVLDLAKLGTQGTATTLKMVLRGADPQTVFKGQLQREKVCAWSDNVPLGDVKAIKNTVGATVNDVLLAAMTGALRRYIQDRGQNTDGLNFRAAVPVNLRSQAEMKKLGNKFGLVFLSLPVGIDDPLDRVWELKRRMDALKKSPEAVIAFGLLQAVGMTPTEIQKIVTGVFGTKTTAVMTNVPGPREQLYLSGHAIEDMMFWVPQSGRVGLGISILSYNGNVRLGVAADKGLVPDPRPIINFFHEEMSAYLELIPKD